MSALDVDVPPVFDLTQDDSDNEPTFQRPVRPQATSGVTLQEAIEVVSDDEDGNSDDEIQEIDAQGNPFIRTPPRLHTPPQLPRPSLALPFNNGGHHRHYPQGGAGPSRPLSANNLRILDPAPTLRPASRPLGSRARAGGAILSFRGTRPRNLNAAGDVIRYAPAELVQPAPRYDRPFGGDIDAASDVATVGGFMEQPMWLFNLALQYARDGPQAYTRVSDVPTFEEAVKNMYGGRTKPRDGFTWDFEREQEPEKVTPPKPSAHSDRTYQQRVLKLMTDVMLPSQRAAFTKQREGQPVPPIPVPAPAPSSSTNVVTATKFTLVCASCDKPLMSGVELPEDRIWALRCGHMICGGCLKKLGTPPPKTSRFLPTFTPQQPLSEKAKGKARALEPFPELDLQSDAFIINHPPQALSDNGFSTTPDFHRDGFPPSPIYDPWSVTVPPSDPWNPTLTQSPPPTRHNARTPAPLPSHPENPLENIALYAPQIHLGNHTVSGTSPLTVDNLRVFDEPLSHEGRVLRSSARRGRGGANPAPSTSRAQTKTKGKGKARAPTNRRGKRKAKGPITTTTVEPWDWRCPVGGCGRPHRRIREVIEPAPGEEGERVEGPWKGEEGNGEIAVFL